MRARHALPALAILAVVALTGCVDNSTPAASGAPGSGTSGAVTKDKAAAALVPADISKGGKLIIGTSPNYAPNEYKDNAGKPIGWAIELSDALAAKLGLKPEYQIAKFENIIPSIVAGKIQVGESSFTDTLEREKQVDFVNYYSAGVQWASGIGKDVDPDNACGLKVAVQATTFEDTDEIPGKSAACVAAGKDPIIKMPFETQDSAANSVVLGQADAFSADSPVTLYAISKLKDKLQPAGKTFDDSPYGLAVPQKSGLVKAVQAALQSMVDDGSYGKILDKWGVGAGGLDTITINAASKG
ncbi:ABC transporter substrate-binding protein [Glaciihabitans sp. UYNi722]|uniref:ABC transporter substrate-binding protein n=1 Tax=Glaciihabitans sp. UYNi722 TaxID=3156344 RepID=UPI003398109C